MGRQPLVSSGNTYDCMATEAGREYFGGHGIRPIRYLIDFAAGVHCLAETRGIDALIV